jgi:2-amino-1-hydroxyethylphosphonate dioxygenase (glycine-forming)
MLPTIEAHAHATVKTLFSFLEAQGSGDYLGESISQLEHSLQCAQLAIQADAPNDTVLGALLHDIGRFIPAAEKMPAMIDAEGTYVGSASHEVLGERYLRALGFNESICALVGAHVMAKRMLCAIEPAYYDGLSKSSKTTLKYQVCPAPPLGFSRCSHTRIGRNFHQRASGKSPARPLAPSKARSSPMG